MGHQVQARWLDGKHQISDKGVPIGDHGEALVEGVDDGLTQVRNAQLRSHFASDDWQDVTSAELVINFTEPPRSSANRGGRHVEYGIALALGKRVIVVGHRENIFHWLPQVEFVETWEAAKAKCSNGPFRRGGAKVNWNHKANQLARCDGRSEMDKGASSACKDLLGGPAAQPDGAGSEGAIGRPVASESGKGAVVIRNPCCRCGSALSSMGWCFVCNDLGC